MKRSALVTMMGMLGAALALVGCGKIDGSEFEGSTPTKDTVANTWQLVFGKDGLFVKCGYGKSLAGPYSHIETIRLPQTAKTCRADFKTGPGAGDLTLTHFACK